MGFIQDGEVDVPALFVARAVGQLENLALCDVAADVLLVAPGVLLRRVDHDAHGVDGVIDDIGLGVIVGAAHDVRTHRAGDQLREGKRGAGLRLAILAGDQQQDFLEPVEAGVRHLVGVHHLDERLLP